MLIAVPLFVAAFGPLLFALLLFVLLSLLALVRASHHRFLKTLHAHTRAARSVSACQRSARARRTHAAVGTMCGGVQAGEHALLLGRLSVFVSVTVCACVRVSVRACRRRARRTHLNSAPASVLLFTPIARFDEYAWMRNATLSRARVDQLRAKACAARRTRSSQSSRTRATASRPSPARAAPVSVAISSSSRAPRT